MRKCCKKILCMIVGVALIFSASPVTLATEEASTHEHIYENGFCSYSDCDSYESAIKVTSENIKTTTVEEVSDLKKAIADERYEDAAKIQYVLIPELEKKIGTMISVPNENSDEHTRRKFNRAIGVPESASEYPTNELYDDENLRNKFFEIGLTSSQVEKIYGIANEFLSPVISDLYSVQNEANAISELKNFILSKTIPKLTDELVNRLSAILMYYSVKNENQKQEHILKVKQDIANKESLVEKGICPKCGGMLIHRQGKYGEFISCINYPSCRFTQNINR